MAKHTRQWSVREDLGVFGNDLERKRIEVTYRGLEKALFRFPIEKFAVRADVISSFDAPIIRLHRHRKAV
jgi:hypothetical protein